MSPNRRLPLPRFVLLAVAPLALAFCSDNPTEPEPPPPITYRLEMVSGSPQSDTIGALLPQPLVVRAMASTGAPAAGQVVRLSPATGSGTVSADSLVTDANGLAQAKWTLGATEGPASVRATLRGTVGSEVTFLATVTLPFLRATALAVGFEHNCATTSSQRLYCWGLNDQGQLGDGTTTSRNTAGPLPGALLFDRVAAGAGHTCAITPADELYCWGRNVWGQVGDGSSVMRTTPVRVAAELRFSHVTAGSEGTCALTVAGVPYCWGFMLGTQSTSHRSPADVSSGLAFTSLTASENEVCGMAVDGGPYCLQATWTADGLSGGPGYLWRPQPAPSPAHRRFAGGLQSMCGLDAAGAASCWGSNDYGQLGTGDTQPRSGVVAVTGELRFRDLYAGYDWTCGVIPQGPTYCWGHNNWGVVTPVVYQRYVEPAPVLLAVPDGLTFTTMDGGFYHMCGIGDDTRVYCWGGGFSGQLGDAHSTANFYNRATLAPVVRR